MLFRFALVETGRVIGLVITLGYGMRGTAETVADAGTLLTGAAFFPFKMDSMSTTTNSELEFFSLDCGIEVTLALEMGIFDKMRALINSGGGLVTLVILSGEADLGVDFTTTAAIGDFLMSIVGEFFCRGIFKWSFAETNGS